MVSGNKNKCKIKAMPDQTKTERRTKKKKFRMQWALGASTQKFKTYSSLVKYCLDSLPASSEILRNTRALPLWQPPLTSHGYMKKRSVATHGSYLWSLWPGNTQRAINSDKIRFLTVCSLPSSLCSISVPWSLCGGGLRHRGRGQWGLQTGLHLL